MTRGVAAQILARLRTDARRIAEPFGLRYASIEAERPQVRSYYGICDSDGRIRIRLFHAVTRRPLKYSSLVNTLCHELAHLRHMNHGKRFQALYEKLLVYARQEGIYRPGRDRLEPWEREANEPSAVVAARAAEAQQAVREPKPGPVQLTLFG